MVMTSDCPKGQVRKVRAMVTIGALASAVGITLGFPVMAQGAARSPESAIRQDLRTMKFLHEEMAEIKDVQGHQELEAEREHVSKDLRSAIRRLLAKNN
jgi:hypothetical protein